MTIFFRIGLDEFHGLVERCEHTLDGSLVLLCEFLVDGDAFEVIVLDVIAGVQHDDGIVVMDFFAEERFHRPSPSDDAALYRSPVVTHAAYGDERDRKSTRLNSSP